MSNFIKNGLVTILCSLTCSFAFANEPTIVKLTPPTISDETVSEKIYCDRPIRVGKFNISLEHDLGKTIINCYGHGGSGWSTLFGSVNKAIQLFLETKPNKDTPIRIVGSGCMGLTTAIELSRLGYNVVGVSTKSLYDMSSWKAAGYFGIVAVTVKTSPEEQENLNNIGFDTFRTYQKIDRGEHPYITKDAVKYMPVYCNPDAKVGLEGLEARGMIPQREYVTLDFGNGVVHKGYIKYMTYFLNTTTLMRQLTAAVNTLNIPIEMKEVKSFDEISESTIFNCTGLGSRELNRDRDVIGVRGHLVMLNEKSGTKHMDYMVITTVKQDGKEEYVYLIPKNISVTPENISGTPCFGALGGTFIPNVDKLTPSEQKKIDSSEFKRLLERNSEFFQGHSFNLETAVGDGKLMESSEP